MKRTRLFLLALVFILILGGCRNETQNRIRRSIQDFTAVEMYITIYTISGEPVFTGIVDGKVTRSSTKQDNSNELASGGYIYWFDERGRYYQTDMPYLVTTNNPNDGSRNTPAPTGNE